MLKQRPDDEWREIESLLAIDPRRAMYRFQTQPSRRLVRFARLILLPLFIPFLASWLIWGQEATITGLLLVVSLAAAVVILGVSFYSLYQVFARGRLIKRFAAEYNGRFHRNLTSAEYAAGQTWIIQQCLAKENPGWTLRIRS